MIATPAFSQSLNTTARQCANAAAKKARGTVVKCEKDEDLLEFGCEVKAAAGAQPATLDAIRGEAHACLLVKGSRKLSEAEVGKLYHSGGSDFYEFRKVGGRETGITLQKWGIDKKDKSRPYLYLIVVD